MFKCVKNFLVGSDDISKSKIFCFLEKSQQLSTWLQAVGCFIFGAAVLIYLFPCVICQLVIEQTKHKQNTL